MQPPPPSETYIFWKTKSVFQNHPEVHLRCREVMRSLPTEDLLDTSQRRFWIGRVPLQISLCVESGFNEGSWNGSPTDIKRIIWVATSLLLCRSANGRIKSCVCLLKNIDTMCSYLRKGAFSSMSSNVSKEDLWEINRRLWRKETINSKLNSKASGKTNNLLQPKIAQYFVHNWTELNSLF